MAKDVPFDPYEFGARNADPDAAGLEPLLPTPARFKPKQLLFGFLAVIVVGALIKSGGSRTPALAASCTAPTFAVSTDSVKQYGVVRWSAVGPSDRRVVLAVDSPTVPAGRATATGAGRVYGPTALTSCRASGLFGVPTAPGQHTITAFVVAADGTATPLGSKPLEVRGP